MIRRLPSMTVGGITTEPFAPRCDGDPCASLRAIEPPLCQGEEGLPAGGIEHGRPLERRIHGGERRVSVHLR